MVCKSREWRYDEGKIYTKSITITRPYSEPSLFTMEAGVGESGDAFFCRIAKRISIVRAFEIGVTNGVISFDIKLHSLVDQEEDFWLLNVLGMNLVYLFLYIIFSPCIAISCG